MYAVFHALIGMSPMVIRLITFSMCALFIILMNGEKVVSLALLQRVKISFKLRMSMIGWPGKPR